MLTSSGRRWSPPAPFKTVIVENKGSLTPFWIEARRKPQEVRAPLPVWGWKERTGQYNSSVLDIFSLMIVTFWVPQGALKGSQIGAWWVREQIQGSLEGREVSCARETRYRTVGNWENDPGWRAKRPAGSGPRSSHIHGLAVTRCPRLPSEAKGKRVAKNETEKRKDWIYRCPFPLKIQASPLIFLSLNFPIWDWGQK